MMKPVVIIIISVVCSIGAVFGVLIGWEMYQMYLYEKGLALGVDVVKAYEYNLSYIKTCIPNDINCYNRIVSRFDVDFDKLTQKHGFNVNDQSISEYRQVAHNLLKIEYDYQNQIYQINSDYSNSYYDSYYRDENPLVNYWQDAYQIAVANTRIGVTNSQIERENKMIINSGNKLDIDSCPEGVSLLDCYSSQHPPVTKEQPKTTVSNKYSQTENTSTTPYKIKGGDRLVVSLVFDPSQKTILYEKSRDTDKPSLDLCPDCKVIYPEVFNSKICKLRPYEEVCQQGWVPLELWFGQYILDINGNQTSITISENTPSLPYFKN